MATGLGRCGNWSVSVAYVVAQREDQTWRTRDHSVKFKLSQVNLRIVLIAGAFVFCVV
jgi:hypothetical protein